MLPLSIFNKGTPVSATSASSSEIFLRWIIEKYLTSLSYFSRVGLCFSLINFLQLGDGRCYSQTLQWQFQSRLAAWPSAHCDYNAKLMSLAVVARVTQFSKINRPKTKAQSRESRNTCRIFFDYPSQKNFWAQSRGNTYQGPLVRLMQSLPYRYFFSTFAFPHYSRYKVETLSKWVKSSKKFLSGLKTFITVTKMLQE